MIFSQNKFIKIFKKFAVFLRNKFASIITVILSNIKICNANFGPSSCQITFLRRPIQKEKIDERLTILTKALINNYQKSIPFALEIAKENNLMNGSWNKELTSINGEHYFLIQLLCKELKPKSVIEIGTFLGSSTRVFLSDEHIEKLVSFDLVPWYKFTNSYLSYLDKDLLNSKFKQYFDNLIIESNFEKYLDIFLNCDLIFLDGPKNKKFESQIFYYFIKVKPKKPVFILVDDIHLSTMVDLWNDLPFHKIDLSFIGHWSGSGLFIWE